jgi:hypothetical protein
MSQKQRAALGYAELLNWPVFPLHAIDERGCTCRRPCGDNAAKHPRVTGGFHSATRDAGQIREWWKQWPDANIGVPAGAVSGLVVLDVDPDKGGDDTLYELEREYAELPETVEQITGGGGRHVLFTHPGGPVPNSAGAIGPGLDIRGDGGYILVAPSDHASGGTYAWDHRPLEVALAPMPKWLLARALPRVGDDGRNSRRPVGEWVALLGGVEAGKRNASATSLAGHYVAHGLSPLEVHALLILWDARNTPPLGAQELERVVTSIWSREARKARAA